MSANLEKSNQRSWEESEAVTAGKRRSVQKEKPLEKDTTLIMTTRVNIRTHTIMLLIGQKDFPILDPLSTIQMERRNLRNLEG